MTKSDENFLGYLKFSGPSVDGGEINAGKVGKSLVALDRIFKKYNRVINNDKNNQFQIKVKGLKKGSTTVQVVIEQMVPVAKPVAESLSFLLIAKSIGITEFGKQFFGTLAQQLVLKMFAKGKRLKEEKTFLQGPTVYVKLVNIDGEEKSIPISDWENYKLLYSDSRELVQIDPEEKMTVGYKENNKNNDLATISYQDKEYFDSDLERSIKEKDQDLFDDKNAVDTKIIGKFVDFYSLAHKYPFAFQARKEQEIIGKQKILCMVQSNDVSKIINYLKPENSKNICIFGKATKDYDGKINKIKIKWFSENLNFDPKQTNISI